MTWAKIDLDFGDDPALLALPRGVRLLYVEGILWCCRLLTDGAIPSHALRKITDEDDVASAAAQLVAAGLWTATPTGWEVAGFLDMQPGREEVERARAASRFRAERSRRHKAGDHATCTRGRFCPDGELDPGAGARAGAPTAHVRSLDADVDVDDRRGVKSRKPQRTPASANAAAGAASAVPRFTVVDLCRHHVTRSTCTRCNKAAA